MHIVVLADDDQWKELTRNADLVKWARIFRLDSGSIQADAFLILSGADIHGLLHLKKPVLFNSVVKTLKELNAPPNVIRINGWKSFLARKQWEVAGNVTSELREIFLAMDKQVSIVADVPGLVVARPVAMIINEAYFALEQQVSTKEEIDIAMKLGTNYPYGPFEWANIIGLQNVYDLLYSLSLSDKKYTPCSLLKKEAAV
jgi:3-hydroxybutyryl-CoA dehydrogenase